MKPRLHFQQGGRPQMLKPQTAARPVAQPLHRQVRDLIMARIESGEWSPGTYLPPETRLAEDYGVAVGTLRKALLDLVAEGVVVRRQGKGTVVATHDSDAVLFRFFNLRRPDGSTLRPESRVLSRNRRAASADEANALGMREGADIISITRVRDGDGAPIIYEHILLEAARFGRLETSPEHLPNTLYQLYQTDFGVTVHRALEQITAGSATGACATELGLPEHTPILQVRRVALDYNAMPVELRLSWVNTADLHYQAAV
jgi:GntR family transcriptional regulator